MNDRIMIDTNLWVYFFSQIRTTKHQTVYQLIEEKFEWIFSSTQILGELYNVLTKKNLVNKDQANYIVLQMIDAFPVLGIETETILKSIEINKHYQYSYWDSSIIATALLNDCRYLYTEDLQHDQLIENTLKIVNPFRE